MHTDLRMMGWKLLCRFHTGFDSPDRSHLQNNSPRQDGSHVMVRVWVLSCLSSCWRYTFRAVLANNVRTVTYTTLLYLLFGYFIFKFKNFRDLSNYVSGQLMPFSHMNTLSDALSSNHCLSKYHAMSSGLRAHVLFPRDSIHLVYSSDAVAADYQ